MRWFTLLLALGGHNGRRRGGQRAVGGEAVDKGHIDRLAGDRLAVAVSILLRLGLAPPLRLR